MNDAVPAIEMFQTRFRNEFQQFPVAIGNAIPDGQGNYTLLDIPCPSNPDRCRLGVLYHGDCFEVWFSLAGTRGPAEHQILIDKDLAGSVSAAIDFIRDIITSRILVDIYRYQWFWFKPYYLAFFREASRPPKGRSVQTISWVDCGVPIGARFTATIP